VTSTLTVNSGFLSKLLPGDIVLADRGIRQLANVRIHRERVIVATRQRFSILMSCIPIDFVKPKV